MIDKRMQDAINDQINAEIYSAYLYYAMVYYFDDKNLTGFAKWMRVQALEEMTHAHKLAAYVSERGGRPVMTAIDGPDNDWESPLAVAEAVYKHECHVSARINKLVDLARELSDHATYNMLQWFVGEQVEEEASADEVVQKLKLVEGQGQGLFMIDQELGQRMFTPPVWLAGVF
ncbi:MAG: ferritin [Deltaproteobacteria bacterium]|nr:ferritin [Deltaproteobacteria bacterium]